MPLLSPRFAAALGASSLAILFPGSLGSQARPDSAARDSLARATQSLAPFAVRATRSSQDTFNSPLAITRIDRSQLAGKAG